MTTDNKPCANSEFDLSDWEDYGNESYPSIYPKDKVEEFIKRLKKDCFICGKNLSSIRNRQGYHKVDLCSKCKSDMNLKSYGRVQKRLNKKIDKLAGDDLQ